MKNKYYFFFLATLAITSPAQLYGMKKITEKLLGCCMKSFLGFGNNQNKESKKHKRESDQASLEVIEEQTNKFPPQKKPNSDS
ncbi:hypothetical protein KAH94_04730 [bacterium]|nr:hypothetical protein [bacterium]